MRLDSAKQNFFGGDRFGVKPRGSVFRSVPRRGRTARKTFKKNREQNETDRAVFFAVRRLRRAGARACRSTCCSSDVCERVLAFPCLRLQPSCSLSSALPFATIPSTPGRRSHTRPYLAEELGRDAEIRGDVMLRNTLRDGWITLQEINIFIMRRSRN